MTDDIIHYLQAMQLPGLVVAIDFTKAFDTVSKKFILDSLKLYGFGPDFSRWYPCILLLQADSCINHFGWISEPFSIKWGIQQGCPSSGLIFVLAVKLLAIKIWSSSVNGIKISQTTPMNNLLEIILKIQQFADNTTLYLKDKQDLNTVMDIFSSFAAVTELKINSQETCG